MWHGSTVRVDFPGAILDQVTLGMGKASAEPCSWLAESGDQVEKGGLCIVHVIDSDALWGPRVVIKG